MVLTGVNQIQFNINTTAWRSYKVEYKDDLADPKWAPLGDPHSASGSSLLIANAPVTGPQRFYRVALLP